MSIAIRGNHGRDASKMIEMSLHICSGNVRSSVNLIR